MFNLLKNITLCFLLIRCASAQTYVPIPTDNAFWDSGAYGLIYFRYFETICGEDTVINSVSYKKLLLYSYDYPNGIVYPPSYSAAVRNDSVNKIVYFVPAGQSAEHIMYDFNLNAGDSISLYMYGSMETRKVDSVYYLNISGNNRKAIIFEPPYFLSGNEHWIEGIGSLYGVSNRGAAPGLDYSPFMACQFVNGNLVYTSDTAHSCRIFDCDPIAVSDQSSLAKNNLNIFPVPAADFLAIDHLMENNIKRIILSNSLGQLLSEITIHANREVIDLTSYPEGIYFLSFFDSQKQILTRKFIK